ncbi:MAG: hypothetical protein WKG00_24425 [Polyangiaceae bacterium]
MARLVVAAACVAVGVAGCGDDGGDGDGDGDGDGGEGASNSTSNPTQGAVGNGSGPGSGAGGQGSGCFQVLTGPWHLMFNEEPSMCPNGPYDCDVDQQACSVSVASDKLGGTVALDIDASGTTEEVQVNTGDGVIAACHAVFQNDFGTSLGSIYSMTLVCSAQGVTCTYGESKIFDD